MPFGVALGPVLGAKDDPTDGPEDGPSLRTKGVADGATVLVLLQNTILDTPTGPLTLTSILPTCSMPSKTLATDPIAAPGTIIVCTP